MPIAVVGAAIGLLWGLAADRFAARWPVHEDGAVRGIDWRTPIVAIAGLAAGALLVDRFGATPGQLAVMAIAVAALVGLFAIDLDQRLLPDVITYPLAGLALVAFALGVNPFVHDTTELAFAAAAAIAMPLLLYVLSIPFGRGAIGRGDLKLLVGVGLLGGPYRLFLGLVAGAILASVAILLLLVLRRITLRTYVPYGPFLIAGALWALLAGVGI